MQENFMNTCPNCCQPSMVMGISISYILGYLLCFRTMTPSSDRNQIIQALDSTLLHPSEFFAAVNRKLPQQNSAVLIDIYSGSLTVSGL